MSNEGQLPESEWSEQPAEGMDPQRLCDAASALFYAIARHQFQRTGDPIPIPIHLCPTSRPTCICKFSRREIDEAEAFLLRIGVIARRQTEEMPMIDL